MEVINLTPHKIRIITGDKVNEIEASGTIARVATKIISTDNPIIFKQEFGEVENLPEPKENTIFIVSALVLARVSERNDVFAPLTSQAIRNEEGQIIGVPGLVR